MCCQKGNVSEELCSGVVRVLGEEGREGRRGLERAGLWKVWALGLSKE